MAPAGEEGGLTEDVVAGAVTSPGPGDGDGMTTAGSDTVTLSTEPPLCFKATPLNVPDTLNVDGALPEANEK